MTSQFKRKPELDFSNIKSTVSPFAIRQGEKIECVLNAKKHIYIDKYIITENEKKVLNCINYLSLTTSKQISTMLSDQNISQEEINDALGRLYSGGYLRKFTFVSDLGNSSFKVYTISGDRGSILYRSVFSQRPNKTSLIELINTSAEFKRILACNQLICQLADLKETKISSHFQVFSLKRFLRKPLLIRTSGYIETSEGCAFIESIRREDGYAEKFKERLSRYEKIVRKYKKLDSIFESKVPCLPTVVVITEDDAQRDEIMNLCKKSKLARNMIFTHDIALVGPITEAFKTL